MKMMTFLLFPLFLMSPGGWRSDFKEAQSEAIKTKRHILLNFSGSDWCGPCIRLRKDIFDSQQFMNFADSNLVLVNADFPRSAKNKQDKELVKQNEALADRFNPKGLFPFTLLLDAQGNILKEWEGFPQESAAAFTSEIKSIL